eukprot:scaffold57253_cov64-Phaeocystis_antarctica.AAC.3
MGKGGGIGGFRGGKLEQLGGSGCGPCGWASAWWNPAAQSHAHIEEVRQPSRGTAKDSTLGWEHGGWEHGSTDAREHVDHAAARRADVSKVPGVHRWVLAKVSAVQLQRAVAAHAVLRVVVRVRVVVQPVRKTSGLRPRPAGSISARSCLRLCPELRARPIRRLVRVRAGRPNRPCFRHEHAQAAAERRAARGVGGGVEDVLLPHRSERGRAGDPRALEVELERLEREQPLVLVQHLEAEDEAYRGREAEAEAEESRSA